MDSVKWIRGQIKYITENYKRRTAGTKSVKDCQEYMAGLLKEWTDEHRKETFRFSPHAFMASIPLEAALGMTAALLFFLSHFVHALLWVVPILSIILFISMICEYILYLQTFDFLYPKAIGQNLYATRKASGETKKRVIIAGHADAAFEMPIIQWQKPLLFYTLIIIAYGVTFLSPILSIIFLINGTETNLVLGIIIFALSFSFMPFLFFVTWKNVVDGANDNLSGCMIGINIIREMAEKNERFENTDVCVLITDGEESGLRGANAFSKANRKELEEVETIVIGVDTIRELECLEIYHRGINWTQANSPYVCDLLKRAGENMGFNLKKTTFYPGANDSEAFSRNGFQAASLCGNNHIPIGYYHWRGDTWDNMDDRTLEVGLSIVKEAVRIFAEE